MQEEVHAIGCDADKGYLACNKNKLIGMAELTGLESILEKSHYKTERRHKYSFGKSHRFPELKSAYTPAHAATPSTSTTSPSPGTRAPAASATAASFSSRRCPTAPAPPPITSPARRRPAYPSVPAGMYPSPHSESPRRRLPQRIH